MALIPVFSIQQTWFGKFLRCHLWNIHNKPVWFWHHASLRFCTCAFTRTFAHKPLVDATGSAHVCQTSCDISSCSFCLSLYLKSWFRQIKWFMNFMIYYTHGGLHLGVSYIKSPLFDEYLIDQGTLTWPLVLEIQVSRRRARRISWNRRVVFTAMKMSVSSKDGCGFIFLHSWRFCFCFSLTTSLWWLTDSLLDMNCVLSRPRGAVGFWSLRVRSCKSSKTRMNRVRAKTGSAWNSLLKIIF